MAIIIAGYGPTDKDGNQPTMKNNSLKLLSVALSVNNVVKLYFGKKNG